MQVLGRPATLRRSVGRWRSAAPRLLFVALALGCGGARADTDSDADVIPVLVQPVTRVHRPALFSLSGDVEGSRTINLGFLVPGAVQTVGVREGDVVEEGQLLAALDPTDYRLNLEMAAAQRERAEQELARATAMFDEKGIPENDLQKAQVAVRIARAQEAMATKKLADSRLVSPLAGVVARRAIEPFEQTGPGMPVFTVVQVNPAQVRVGVPETEIDRVSLGQRAQVGFPSLGGATFVGTVRVVGIAADPASRTYTVKIQVANGDRRLRPGMVAEVRIESSDSVRTLTVPGEAIVRDPDGVTYLFVYAPEEKRVHRRRVDVGTVYGQEVEIRRGLDGEELVVVGGQNRVREASSVAVRTAGAEPGTKAPEVPQDRR